MLVAQHNLPVNMRDGDNVRAVPAGLSVFRVGADGNSDVCTRVRHRCRQRDHVVDGNGAALKTIQRKHRFPFAGAR
jgi:hypothetical protein